MANCGIVLAALTMLTFSACESSSTHKTIGNTKDTGSVFKGGGPPIRDTSTINNDRKDSANRPASDSTSKGNVDPSGHMSKPSTH
ncbi:hypothetical protein [Mucilaginibacter aquaedulcis]|uniref:hypothetical protein n=1 Tax=Mucilaginibacter aquaedulcis TaxID=1187081 RepID=UPI0025B4A28A|nr:hypothetical protein [Mucilaginibacter aquaedulcis]MDN3551178.1 hypothetical protein [Mucilaginibacter aquaedulcis]